MAILVQGRGKSEFGNVATYGYVQEVFGKVSALSGIKSYSIILSAHSGGGETRLAPMVIAGEAQPADAATLKKDPARAASKGGADLVVLFDAEGIEDTMAWATDQIAALGKALTADPKNAKAILAASPKFRGYFAEGGFYATRYTTQAKKLNAALAKLPSRWRDLTSSDVVVPDLFRIVQVDRIAVPPLTCRPWRVRSFTGELAASRATEGRSRLLREPGTGGLTPADWARFTRYF